MVERSSGIFDVAARIRAARPLADVSLEFLQSVFAEQGYTLTPCEVLTATYYAWYGSALSSGVTWRDHLRQIAPSMHDCEPDEALRQAHEVIAGHRRAAEAEQVLAQEQRERWVSGGLFTALAVAVLGGGFIIHRRLKLTEEEALRAERRRRHRRRSRTSASSSATDDAPFQATRSDASA